jgi:uncharacterized membrane protein
MEISMFIAKIFGLCYLVVGVGLAFNRKLFQKTMKDFCENSALVFLSGLSALVIGVVIILVHNIWVANWTVIITLIGWAAFTKGAWMLIFPNTVCQFIKAYLKNENLLTLHLVIVLIFGGVLTFFGFFSG